MTALEVVVPASVAIIGAVTGVILELRHWGDDWQHSAWFAEHLQREIEETRRRNANLERAIIEPIAAPTPFEAFLDCPICGHFACHWLRPPVPAPDWDRLVAGRMTSALSDMQVELLGWPLVHRREQLGTFRPTTEKLWCADEHRYAIIRACRSCNHEWGQI
ncbi:MAG TPA: hypothetical protein VK537_07595 [Galbitalea sp.]|nr:hypothetical protein [Galbitalea sp.]